MIKKNIRSRFSRAGKVPRILSLLLLPLAMAAGSLEAWEPPVRNELNAQGTSVFEGDDGIQYALVTVTLSSPRGGKSISVNYRTYDGSAKAGSDYDAVSGKLTFAKGQTSKTVSIPIRGDRMGEWDPATAYNGGHEYFYFELFNPTNGGTLGFYGDTVAVEIWDNEPRLTFSGGAISEGNSGTTPFTFYLSLSPASNETVRVDFSTQDYTALEGIDYVAASGTLTFAPGETYKSFTVDVIGNTLAEPDKHFYVNLDLSGVPASVSRTETSFTGAIADDDGYYDYGWGWDYGYYYGWDYGYYY
jgi:hypothetical protein